MTAADRADTRCDVCRRGGASPDPGRGCLCANCRLAVTHVEADHTRFRRILGYLKKWARGG